ncbi:MAG TPA: serine/threonine-protein kinase, partial [Polyangia bacterium]
MSEASQKTVTALGSDAGSGRRREGAWSPDSRVGELVSGKYRITRWIARGGMGEVYEAEHLLLRRRVALKCLNAALAHDEAYVRRFCREAKAAASLQSEHIATVTDIDFLPDRAPYLVMELLDGEDLARTIKRGPLPVSRAVDIALQVCRGLALAHRSGLVHRDLKPANVFLCRRDDGGVLAKILDFGIAKMSTVEEVALTGPGAVMGTAYYMAPEQARGSLTVDARADIYAIGAMLYEALSGRRPFQGSTYNEVLYKVMTTTPTPLGALDPALPERLTAVIARAMAPDPEDRHPSVEDLAAALSSFEEAGAGALPRPAAGEDRPKTRRPLRTRISIAAGAVVACGAIALLAPWLSKTEAPAALRALPSASLREAPVAPVTAAIASPPSLVVGAIPRTQPNDDEAKP